MKTLSKFLYLRNTAAPAVLWVQHVLFSINRRSIKRSQIEKSKIYKGKTASLELSADWFTRRIPYWTYVFKKFDFYNRKTRILEVGSWEGLSSFFICSELPKTQLTCVDTWAGADEHQDDPETLRMIESRFDRNTLEFKDRITKYKGTSLSYFNITIPEPTFDLIYIDGSHFCDDVLIDALRGFALLKPGGIMIFDDYFWRFYDNPLDNPASAINAFLRLKKESLRVVLFYSQVVIQKVETI